MVDQVFTDGPDNVLFSNPRSTSEPTYTEDFATLGGDDRVTILWAGDYTISMGTGDDFVSTSPAIVWWLFPQDGPSGILTSRYDISLGEGDDYVRVAGGSGSFSGGLGYDTLDASSLFYRASGIFSGSADVIVNGRDTGITIDTAAGTISFAGYPSVTVQVRSNPAPDPYVIGAAFAFDLSITGFEEYRATGGNDTLLGSDQAYEKFLPGRGIDQIDGRDGWDDVSFEDFTSDTIGFIANLAAGTYRATLEGISGTLQNIEGLEGGFADDTLTGDEEANTLSGLAGNDRLTGGNGADTLSGGEGDDELRGARGDDSLDGGAGEDILTGGLGEDVFVVDAEGDLDVITDFTFGVDRLEILGLVVEEDETGGPAVDGVMISAIDVDDLVDNIRLSVDGDPFLDLRNAMIGLREDVLSKFTFVEQPLIGSRPGETIVGTNSADRLLGLAGNDTLSGGGSNDTLLGGAGNDFLRGGFKGDLLFGGTGNDILRGGDGRDSLYGGFGDDELLGGNGRDTLDGGPGRDVYTGGQGADTFVISMPNAGDLDEVTDFQVGLDKFDLRSVFVNGRPVTLEDLTIARTGMPEPGFGLAIRDSVIPDTAAIRLVDLPPATLTPEGLLQPRNFIFGDDGPVNLIGGDGQQNLVGGLFGDQIWGGNGGDALRGLGGSDLILGGAGRDVIEGGRGSDGLFGGSFADRLLGGIGADILVGDEGNDTLNGGEGTDTLVGGDGRDNLVGGRGIDLLFGGRGANQMTGGDGADTFLFTLDSIDGRRDVITDFDPSEDTITMAESSMLESIQIFLEADKLLIQPGGAAEPEIELEFQDVLLELLQGVTILP